MAPFELELAGQQWQIEISDAELQGVHLPLLETMMHKAAAKTGRYLTLLAGPPGSGKTALGALWARLAQNYDCPSVVQTLPLDGFHFTNTELDARTILWQGKLCALRQIKGAPETYDLARLTAMFRALRAGRDMAWPRYDRQLHDPVPDALPVPAEGVILLEGNYLLLDEAGWRDMVGIADFTIFVECDETLARDRVLARAVRGGRSQVSARQHYARTDAPNRLRIMQHRLASDLVLRVDASGRITQI